MLWRKKLPWVLVWIGQNIIMAVRFGFGSVTAASDAVRVGTEITSVLHWRAQTIHTLL